MIRTSTSRRRGPARACTIRGTRRHQASLRLVGRLGFRKEGYSPAMLFIDGDWRDHERWAITREMTDFPPVAPHPTRPAR